MSYKRGALAVGLFCNIERRRRHASRRRCRCHGISDVLESLAPFGDPRILEHDLHAVECIAVPAAANSSWPMDWPLESLNQRWPATLVAAGGGDRGAVVAPVGIRPRLLAAVLWFSSATVSGPCRRNCRPIGCRCRSAPVPATSNPPVLAALVLMALITSPTVWSP